MAEKKTRKLSKAEERRAELFRQKTEELESQGYKCRDLTVDLVKANVKGSLYGVIAAIPFLVIYILIKVLPLITGSAASNNTNPEAADSSWFVRTFGSMDSFFTKYLIFFAVMVVLIVVHELIHGITWGSFAKGKLKSIEFGFIFQSLNPYCTCKEPLRRNQYLIGALMPCIVLGIIPSIVGCILQNGWVLAMGLIMIMSAGGDLLIAKLIRDVPTKEDSLYLDHPTTIGLALFERQ